MKSTEYSLKQRMGYDFHDISFFLHLYFLVFLLKIIFKKRMTIKKMYPR